MTMNPGFAAQVREVLADPMNLPAEFLDYMVQYHAVNPVPVNTLRAAALVASGVGSSSNTPTRYVGGTTAGAPTTGTYVAGDFVVSHDGHVYICTTGGTPGTWSTWPAQGEISYLAHVNEVLVTSTSSSSPTTIVSGVSATYTGVDIYVEAFAATLSTPSVSGSSLNITVQRDGSNLGVPITYVTPAAGAMNVPLYIQIKDTPSSGSHTYSLAAWASTTTGSPGVGGLGNSIFLRTRYA